jgi:hypothetical protein
MAVFFVLAPFGVVAAIAGFCTSVALPVLEGWLGERIESKRVRPQGWRGAPTQPGCAEPRHTLPCEPPPPLQPQAHSPVAYAILLPASWGDVWVRDTETFCVVCGEPVLEVRHQDTVFCACSSTLPYENKQ